MGELNTASAIVTIIDDDPTDPSPIITLSDATFGESDGTVTLFAELNAPAVNEVSASVSAGGELAESSDFTLLTSSVIFRAGQDRAAINIEIIDDTVFEDPEMFQISLSNITGAAAGETTAEVTITDNDSAPPRVTEDDPNGDGVFVTLAAENIWSSGFVARGEIINNSSQRLTKWTFELDLQQGSIAKVWGAQVIEQQGNTYILAAAKYNGEINTGDSASWGMQVNGAFASPTLSDVATDLPF